MPTGKYSLHNSFKKLLFEAQLAQTQTTPRYCRDQGCFENPFGCIYTTAPISVAQGTSQKRRKKDEKGQNTKNLTMNTVSKNYLLRQDKYNSNINRQANINGEKYKEFLLLVK